MPRPGWIKLYYSLLDNPMWTQKPFTEGQAWVDLLLLAAHEEHTVQTENGPDVWEPGTVHLSRSFLMERWGWTKWQYNKVVEGWEKQNMIERPKFQPKNQPMKIRPITIVKWGFFQGSKAKKQPINQPKNQPQHKKYIQTGGGGGSTPRLAGDVEVVKIDGKWVARVK